MLKLKITLAFISLIALGACTDSTSPSKSEAANSSSSVSVVSSSLGTSSVGQSSSSGNTARSSIGTSSATQEELNVNVIYEAFSDQIEGSFAIALAVTNNEKFPIRIVEANYVIQGSNGAILTDIVPADGDLLTNKWIQPGETYEFFQSGYSDSFVPYSWKFELIFSDMDGNLGSDVYSGVFEILARKK
jgi:hypothetical protein